jgi:hypothetical protein
MPNIDPHITRRGILVAGAASLLPSGLVVAAEPLITVHRDPELRLLPLPQSWPLAIPVFRAKFGLRDIWLLQVG